MPDVSFVETDTAEDLVPDTPVEDIEVLELNDMVSDTVKITPDDIAAINEAVKEDGQNA